MKFRIFALLLILFAFFFTASSQTTKPQIRWVSTLPATCSPTRAAEALVYKYTATAGLYRCSATNTWTVVGGTSFTGGAVTTPITFADGTAGAPSMAFTSDADGTGTGIFRSAANSIGFSTNGTERWVINASGAFNPIVNNTYDIGNGTVNPRDVYIARSPYFTAFTAGSVPFIGASGVVQQDNARFFWDTSSNALFIGATTTSHVRFGTAYGTVGKTIRSTNDGNDVLSIGVPTALRLTDANGNSPWDILPNGSFALYRTITAAATTGNQTIDKPAGTVNIAAAGSTVTVTNSLVTANSIIFAVVRTNDGTALIKNVVPGAGLFVITMNAAVTNETSIGFWVTN